MGATSSVSHEFNPGGNQGLPLGEKTLADRLRARRYVTGLVGNGTSARCRKCTSARL